MGLWENVYPQAGKPIRHKNNSAIASAGNFFVLNVVFSSLGSNGVIKAFANSNLLVFHATFVAPEDENEDPVQGAGGAIQCMMGSCYQFGVCSIGSYCKHPGSHSATSSFTKNAMELCSITQAEGKDCTVTFGPRQEQNQASVCEINTLNNSYSKAGGLETMFSSGTHSFLQFQHISITTELVGFRFVDSENKFLNCVFSRITNYNSNKSIFRAHDSLNTRKTVFKDCIFSDNKAVQLFESESLDHIAFDKTYFNNPLVQENDMLANYHKFDLNLQMYSTELCGAKDPIGDEGFLDLVDGDDDKESEETLAVDRPNFILWYSLVKYIV